MKAQRDAKILLVDYETLPMLFYAWQPWDASALRIVEDTTFCSWSAKWLGGKQTTRALCDYKGYRAHSRDDRALLAELWKLLDEADVVVAHNLDRFDDKKVTYRFMAHGFGPPSPYQHVDTLKEIKKVAGHDSNKLNELCRVHGIGRKVRTGGADLWFDCLGGDMKAWGRMKRYNARDVKLLESLYLMLRPWMKTHPNMGTYRGASCCPKCGSVKIQKRGTARTTTRAYARFQCQNCGGWSRATESEASASLV